ncbi:cupin domain-containing protein [Bacillus solimangrovi]|uniref:Cupin type-2 domain-containing protein n=1 Tax=Bacillus solimangrovi TaxID=1305675 RepID=A0A1E5LHK8_9BACI|nr:cupin domain-containing protein [Bacillus solimangrovi]OEH93548.1 hypothetical protein BFG57_00735 [Bacillus solimangrovi]
MYNTPYFYPYLYPYYINGQIYTYGSSPVYRTTANESRFYSSYSINSNGADFFEDYGKKPLVFNINEATKLNNTYRTAIWTGPYLQATLMSIDVGDDIGLELHPDVDQFIRVEQGEGLVQMGETKENLKFERIVYDDYAIFIPAGKWHNLTNIGNTPLKLYSIYAPPNHAFGTVHVTKADALAAEEG